MKDPDQLLLEALGWEIRTLPVKVSSNVVFLFPEWSQRVVSLKEQMIALGSSKEEAEEIINEIQQKIPEHLVKIRKTYSDQDKTRTI
jgi:hypothetical protein